MGWIYLPEAALAHLPLNKSYQITKQSAMSNGKPTARLYSFLESRMDSLMMRQFGTMYEPLTVNNGVAKLILSMGASPVSHSLSLENDRGKPMKKICGLIPSESLAKYDHDSHCWRTSQVSLFSNTLDEFSGAWPRSGMMLNGYLYQLPKSERTTKGQDNGYWPTPTTGRADQGLSPSQFKRHSFNLAQTVELREKWPTPSSRDYKGAYSEANQKLKPRNLLPDAVKKFPTPTAHDAYGKGYKGQLQTEINGTLNPTWVEWLMGWPSGWTDLKCLGMDGFHRWLKEFCR